MLLEAEERREAGTWGAATLTEVAQEKLAHAAMDQLAEAMGHFFSPNPSVCVLDCEQAWLSDDSLYYDMLEGIQGEVAATRDWAVDTVQSGARYFLVRQKFKMYLQEKQAAEALTRKEAQLNDDNGSSGWGGPGAQFLEHIDKPWLSEAGWGGVSTPRNYREELHDAEAEKRDLLWKTPRQESKRRVADTKARRVSRSGRAFGGSLAGSTIGKKKTAPTLPNRKSEPSTTKMSRSAPLARR